MPDAGPSSGASGEIAEVVEEAVESYFEDLTPEEIEQLPLGEAVRVEVREEVQRVLVTEMFAGPLPPPAVLERYAALYPDAPRIIFTSFEAQELTVGRSKISPSGLTPNAQPRVCAPDSSWP